MGILECDTLGKLAFPEPHEYGHSVLRLMKNGLVAFGGTHHLFGMMDGNPHEVDQLYRLTLQEDEDLEKFAGLLKLDIPTPEMVLNNVRPSNRPRGRYPKVSMVYIHPSEEYVLATALDSLP